MAFGPRRIDSELNVGVTYNPQNRYEKSPEYTGYVGVTARWGGGLPTTKNTDISVNAGFIARVQSMFDIDAKYEARSKFNEIKHDGTRPFWKEIKHFKREDFLCKGDGPNANKDLIDRRLVRILDHIRTVTNQPLNINSGCRCGAHNKKVGGVKNSAHKPVNGVSYAADVKCRTSRARFLLVKYAAKLGVERIGIAKSFIHLDTAPHLPKQVVWLY